MTKLKRTAGLVISVFVTLVCCASCTPNDTSNCTGRYQEIQRILRIPWMKVDSNSMHDLYALSKKELSCDTISTLFFRASYRCLAFHGYHERALDVALDDRFSSRRRLLDTLHIACLYLRLGDTVSARSLIGRAMIDREIVIDAEELADFRGLTRTTFLGLILGRHLGLRVDTSKIAQFRSQIPREVATEVDMIAGDLDMFVAAFVPDKNIDFAR